MTSSDGCEPFLFYQIQFILKYILIQYRHIFILLVLESIYLLKQYSYLLVFKSITCLITFL